MSSSLHVVGDLVEMGPGGGRPAGPGSPRTGGPGPAGPPVGAGTPLIRAARMMAEHGVRWLPVVDSTGRTAGILRLRELQRAFARSDGELAEEIRGQVLEPLFPGREPSVRMRVEAGVVTYTGRFTAPALVPLAERMTRSVAGVRDVRFEDREDDEDAVVAVDPARRPRPQGSRSVAPLPRG